MPTVHNKRHNTAPQDAVYVGRPTKWGNPFTHLAEGRTQAKFLLSSREKALEAYANWIVRQPELMASLHELKGKDLICWCKPASCHADILMELANK